MHSQHQMSQQQYQNKSEAYLNSQLHAQGAEFFKMRQLIQQNNYQQVLDLGCGGGHVSYQVAADAAHVTAYDLSSEMVDLVVRQAQQKGLDQVQGQVGAAESLAFDNQYFDCILTRYSAHHWADVAQAMREMHRVLKPNAHVVIFDVMGSSNPIFDTFLQSIELIRDPSHVRDYSAAEWLHFAEAAGFEVECLDIQSLELDFQTWVERMQTPPAAVATLRDLQQRVSDSVKQHFKIQPDGTWSSQTLYLQLRKR